MLHPLTDGELRAFGRAALRMIDGNSSYPLDLRNLENLSLSDVARRAGVKMNRLDDPHLTTVSIFHAWLRREQDNHIELLWQTFAEEAQAPTVGVRKAFTLHALWLSGRAGNRVSELFAVLGYGREARANRHLHGTMRGILRRAAQTDAVRTDIAPGELASFVLHALEAARGEPTKKAIARLVDITMRAISPLASNTRPPDPPGL